MRRISSSVISREVWTVVRDALLGIVVGGATRRYSCVSRWRGVASGLIIVGRHHLHSWGTLKRLVSRGHGMNLIYHPGWQWLPTYLDVVVA